MESEDGRRLHEEVMQRINVSGAAAIAVCEWLLEQGFDAEVRLSKLAPDYDSRLEYSDSGDIKVTIRGKDYRYEVKNRELDFDSVDSFPYPSIIVDEKYKVDRNHELPLWGYAIVNRNRTGFITISSLTRDTWFVKDGFDSFLKEKRTYVHCPKLKSLRYINLKGDSK